MGGVAVVAGGVCCDGGILIEWFNRTGAIPSFFLWLGWEERVWDGVGVFQGGSDYPSNGLVSAFRVARKLPPNVSSKTT